MRVGENTRSHIAYLLFVLLYFVQKVVAKVFENSTKLPSPHVALSQFAACVSIDMLLYLAEMVYCELRSVASIMAQTISRLNFVLSF